LSRTFLCKVLISNSMVSREIWINMHSWVFKRPQIALVLWTRAILRSLKNSRVHVISKLHSKPCYYLYLHVRKILKYFRFLWLMSNTYARCPMEKSKGHWTFRLSNGSLIVHWNFVCPLVPMDKWNFHRTFAFSVGQLTCLWMT
jgi:hypothetical protein